MHKFSWIREDETPMEAIRRLASFSNSEDESVYDSLKTVDAILDYWSLLDHYGVDYLADIIECIDEGDSAAAYNLFIKKHGVEWSELEDATNIPYTIQKTHEADASGRWERWSFTTKNGVYGGGYASRTDAERAARTASMKE